MRSRVNVRAIPPVASTTGCGGRPLGGPQRFPELGAVRTIVYIDGFNLYYGALKDEPALRWLDVTTLCARLLPNDEIVKVRYFTARISARADDPDAPLRQQVYIRALQTLSPVVSIHYGHYLTTVTRAAVVSPPPRTIEVWKTEEKGSDVNLATYLLLDAFDGRMDAAVLMSNDSDLLMPMKVARLRFGLTVGLLNPHPHPSRALVPLASFVKQVRRGPLAASQFPDTLQDQKGEIRRPDSWRLGRAGFGPESAEQSWNLLIGKCEKSE